MVTFKRPRRGLLFVVSTIIISSSIVGVAVLSAKRQRPQPQSQKEWLTSVPEVGSKIQDLEIINPRIIRQDTDFPGVAFEVRNNSKRAVMAIEIGCGDAAIATDGLVDEQSIKRVIEPYGTLTAEMNGELNPGKPIVITAAIFDDGKEEGDKSSLTLIHKVRVRQRAVRLNAEKEQPVPERSPKQ